MDDSELLVNDFRLDVVLTANLSVCAMGVLSLRIGRVAIRNSDYATRSHVSEEYAREMPSPAVQITSVGVSDKKRSPLRPFARLRPWSRNAIPLP